jgi:hypothetical protein
MSLTNFPNGITSFGIPIIGSPSPSVYGNYWFVDTVNGADGNHGKSPTKPFSTMNAALNHVQTSDVIFVRGDIREELTGSNLVFDVTIIGYGNRPHHADVPGTGYHPGAAVWRPPATPTAATPLLTVRGRGWKFINLLFDCPVDAAAVVLSRNASSGTDEYDASHAQFIGCRFDSGLQGIENSGGVFNVLIEDCNFYRMTTGGAGIICSSTAVAVPLNWVVRNNYFMNNDAHILSSASYWTIQGNTFGAFTTEALDLIHNTAQGDHNTVWANALAGTYSIVGGYTPSATDEWGGNFNSITGGVTAANPA